MDASNSSPGAIAQENWHRRIWLLAGPIILSNLSTPLLGAVDTAVVGRLPDPAYIGGVAIGALIFDFLFWGFGFLRMGTTGFTAQAFGAGNDNELRATLLRPLALAAALGALLIVLQWPISAIAFSLLDASAEVENFASLYYGIRIWSAPATLINYTCLGWLLGTQRTGAVLFLQITINGINILLDIVFVIGFGWGVEGVALASVIAEVIGATLGLIIIFQVLTARGDPRGGAKGEQWRLRSAFQRRHLVALIKVNTDIFIRTLCLIFAFAYFTARGAEMGNVLLAANAVLMHLQQFMAYGLDGFAHAAEILAGGAAGARSRTRFQRVVQVTTIWALGTAILFTAVYALFGTGFINLFTTITEVRVAAGEFLPWMVVSPLISIWSFQLDGIFIGTTRTASMRNAMILSLATYLIACWLLIPVLGNHGLWLAFTLFMAARAITLGLFYPKLKLSIAENV